MLPFALDDQILQVLPGQRKPKMEKAVLKELSRTLRPLDTFSLPDDTFISFTLLLYILLDIGTIFFLL